MIYTCPECGNMVSDQAKKCPKCGCPIKYILNPNAHNGFSLPNMSGKMILYEIICPFKYYWEMIDGYKDNGRTKRKAYWEAFLLNIIVSPFVFNCMALLTIYLLDNIDYTNETSHSANIILRMIFLFIPFFVLFALFKAAVRRLHDANMSGWNMLWFLVPVLGWLWLAYLHCLPTFENNNEYGTYIKTDK